ncbi:MAG: GIY-YIG nuclease family protein, partial [Clostridia bacterium]|nr:GIY-YIG nuclease family protein [Clostridia bacterium]
MTKEELFEKAKLLPLTPGVYLMRNRAGTVIYVGKSKALRNRVSSYFSPSVPHFGKTEKMIRSVHDFEVYHTATELEALLQENAFIKQYMPHYNIKLKD